MSTKSSSGGWMYIVAWIALVWFLLYIFFDLQMSVRLERIPPNTDIVESIKDTVSKSLTVTDYGFVEEEDIINDSND